MKVDARHVNIIWMHVLFRIGLDGRMRLDEMSGCSSCAGLVSSNEADGDQTQSSGLADAWELA
eukprot:scaffold39207_cov13-Tisochrysis_lutea.AAC.1